LAARVNAAVPVARPQGARAPGFAALAGIGWALGLTACSAAPAVRGHEPADAAPATATTAAAIPSAAPTTVAAAAGPPAFCQEPVAEHARPHLGGLLALGAAEALGAEAAKTDGAWTWINLWATWCGPCVRELPRLMAWQRGRLGVPFRLILVSLDEDRAEVERFLAEESAPEPDGRPGAAADLQGVYWLPISARPTFFGTLGLPPMGMLPVQVLVDPQGRVHCAHGGAVHGFHQAAAAAILKSTVPSAPAPVTTATAPGADAPTAGKR
jgi:thiol-disulfide isomerase/thioredoxin